MSLFADYLKEREGKEVVESDKGFATFAIYENGEVYLQDIFVAPAYRQSGIATEMADEVVRIAAERGCHTLIGSVCVDDKAATRNMRVLLAYGLQIYKNVGTMTFLKKEIAGVK